MSSKAQVVREPPSELKSIKPFILRGNQLRQADPVITYYCYFWAIKHILANGLHSASPECTSWTTDLMDELEKRKAVLGSNELIHDDMAAQAYVENFALRIFSNGAAVVENGKATGQTSDTLLAGATLLEICRVFGDLDPETLQKIKFAKFHAARIWKALQAGQDPNPQKTETPITEAPRGPPPDIYGNEPQHPPPPTIEEIPDESIELEPKLARASIYDESLHPSRQSPAPQFNPAPAQLITEDLPSPPRSPGREQSEYFPSTPTIHEPSAPSLFPSSMGPANTSFPGMGPALFPSPAPFPSAEPARFPSYQEPPVRMPYSQESVGHNPGPFQQPRQYQEQVHHVSPQTQAPPKRVKKEITTEDMAKAQKHARWAVSALDYEDVETAIKQFKLGLQLLGVED